MSGLPGHARIVIVGAGIVGNSLAWHLARLGWRDIVLLDKGPLPNPGGSTGHASSFTFPVEYSRQMTAWCMDGIRQFEGLGVFTRCGGIEVARTEERMAELRRRLGAARAYGVDAELVSPSEVKRLVPWIDERLLLGGFHTPGVGVVDPVHAGTLMRQAADRAGRADRLRPDRGHGHRCPGRGASRAIRTDRGDIRTDLIMVCCGVWSARVARMAGATIPLTPAVHQMISIGPVANSPTWQGRSAIP